MVSFGRPCAGGREVMRLMPGKRVVRMSPMAPVMMTGLRLSVFNFG